MITTGENMKTRREEFTREPSKGIPNDQEGREYVLASLRRMDRVVDSQIGPDDKLQMLLTDAQNHEVLCVVVSESFGGRTLKELEQYRKPGLWKQIKAWLNNAIH